jgi:hypothetical protein
MKNKKRKELLKEKETKSHTHKDRNIKTSGVGAGCYCL